MSTMASTGFDYNSPVNVALREWLTANGVDVKDVPIDSHIEYNGRALTLEVYLRSGDGRIVPTRQTRIVSPVTPPPEILSAWPERMAFGDQQ
jgi:hypothetical protein